MSLSEVLVRQTDRHGFNIGPPHEQRPNPYITAGLAFEFHYFVEDPTTALRALQAGLAPKVPQTISGDPAPDAMPAFAPSRCSE